MHVVQCPHPDRTRWRTETLSTIGKMGMPQVDPILVDILLDGLRRMYGNHGVVPEHTFPPQYHVLIRTQNSIGWDQLHRARWSKEWSCLQDEYKHRQPDPRLPIAGPLWVLQTGRFLLDRWLEVWRIRNLARHGRDQIQQQTIRTQSIRAELEALYQLKPHVCPADRSIFHDNVEAHFHQHPSLDVIENWIITFRDAIRASVHQAKQLGLQQNQSLHDYYPIVNSTGQPRRRTSLTAGPPPG